MAEVAALAQELKELVGIEWVAHAAKHILETGSINSKEKAITGQALFTKVWESGVTIPVSKNTFAQYLSNIAKQMESPITSTGRGGSGYYLSLQSTLLATEATEVITADRPTDWGKEKWLYPSLTSWLLGEGYQAKDTSAVRSKALGKWGNPDITGLNVQEHLSSLELEVVTIEAKLGFNGWEVDFFQAVSQRRFANRAYFAFALPEDAAEKLPAELRYYSELFSVGVLVIDMSNERYERLNSGKLNDEDKKELREDDGGSVREVLSAPWHHVPLKYQRDVCDALGINNMAKLHRWGIVEND